MRPREWEHCIFENLYSLKYSAMAPARKWVGGPVSGKKNGADKKIA
jgi:hypothetical protein